MRLLSPLKTAAALITLSGLLLLGGADLARAGMSIAMHQGDTNPTTEGFAPGTFGAASTAGPLPNDLGLAAWEIAGTAQSSQGFYSAPALTTDQQADIAATGFTLTLRSRVLRNGLAPAYDSTDHVVIGGADVNYNGRRWEIQLGINSSGDTVVVLPTSVGNNGPGLSIEAPGPSYTLVGSGSSYHTYQLVYNPTTQSADLFVDGVDRIQGYGGHTSFVAPSALQWGAASGGEANVNFVELQSGAILGVPEPASATLLGIGTLCLGAVAWRRRKKGLG